MASSKKKITQDELRRLMNEQKKKILNNVKKIESPLARYDKDGTLHCIICETIVRSEAVWGVHLNSKNHKQNILNKVKKKEETLKQPSSLSVSNLKRPTPDSVPVPVPIPPKKLKGILKNTKATLKPIEKPPELLESSLTKASTIKSLSSYDGDDDGDDGDDDGGSDEHSHEESTPGTVPDDGKTDGTESHDVLPEGFFDDPKLDAKVRNVEYKDPIEEEWKQFQKEIKEETSKAQQIIAEDQEEATTGRQIDEIDEQIRNWSRVIDLEKKKEEVSTTVFSQNFDRTEDDYSGDEEEFEEFLDWRSKKSFDYKLSKNVYLL